MSSGAATALALRAVLVGGVCGLWLLAAGCTRQPNFTIPVCKTLHAQCACQIGGWVICDHVCVDPKSDPGHCGGCGQRCDGVCVDGACRSDCGARTRCGDRCASDEDPWNCGGCGTVCEGACAGGMCGATAAQCNATGQTVCKGSCVSLYNDPDNCGQCGRSCGGEPCGFGQCCLPGEVLCNGLCADLLSNPLNCGRCGLSCQKCVDGKCR